MLHVGAVRRVHAGVVVAADGAATPPTPPALPTVAQPVVPRAVVAPADHQLRH